MSTGAEVALNRLGAGESNAARRDLRRLMERLSLLAEHLGADDRALVEQVCGHGVPIATVARLSRRPQRAMQRQFHRIMQRVNSKEFTFVLAHFGHFRGVQRRVARSVFLEGTSMRRAASEHRITLHQVRQHVDAIRAIANAAEQRAVATGSRVADEFERAAMAV